jgi:predicted nucleic acid-binding protein
MTHWGRISARVDAEVTSQLEYVRGQTGKTVTEMLREAVALYYKSMTSAPSPAGILEDTGFIGCAVNTAKAQERFQGRPERGEGIEECRESGGAFGGCRESGGAFGGRSGGGLRRGGRSRQVIVVDTGFWLALANLDDADHGHAVKAPCRVTEPLATTWPLLAEACGLLTLRHGSRAARLLVESGIHGAFSVRDLGASELARIGGLMKRYERPPMGFSDACLVVTAEALGSQRILSTDRRDFRPAGWKERKVLENLMALAE